MNVGDLVLMRFVNYSEIGIIIEKIVGIDWGDWRVYFHGSTGLRNCYEDALVPIDECT